MLEKTGVAGLSPESAGQTASIAAVAFVTHGRATKCPMVRGVSPKRPFPPPYSPDPNPMEQVFAKLKRLLGKAKQRTKENTWRRIGRIRCRRTTAYHKNAQTTAEIQDMRIAKKENALDNSASIAADFVAAATNSSGSNARQFDLARGIEHASVAGNPQNRGGPEAK